MKASQITFLSLAAVSAAKLDHNVANVNVQRAATTSCVLTTVLPTITVNLPTGATSTMTSCPKATGTGSGSGSGSNPGAPGSQGSGDAIVYVYTTVYKTVCPTGLVDKTYTITKTCDAAPCSAAPTGLPSGFTVTTTVCTKCGPAPITATLTCPDEAHATIYATTKVTAAPATTTVTPTAGSGSGSSSGPGCPAKSSGTTAVVVPTAGSAKSSGTTPVVVPTAGSGSSSGPGCPAKSSGTPPVVVPTAGSAKSSGTTPVVVPTAGSAKSSGTTAVVVPTAGSGSSSGPGCPAKSSGTTPVVVPTAGSGSGSGCSGKSCGTTVVVVPTPGSSNHTTAVSTPTSVVVSSGIKTAASYSIAPLFFFIGVFWL